MKYFENINAILKKFTNYFFMLLAIACALGMWWIVSQTNQVEAQLEVTLDYNGIPDELVVTKGLINKIAVRVKAPEKLLRSLTQNSIHQGINLSGIKKGFNSVPFDRKQLTDPVLRAFEVIDINPPRLELEAETIITKRVPVVLNPINPVNSLVTAEGLTSVPSTIELKGPESELAKYSSIKADVPIEIKKDKNGNEKYQATVSLDTPNFVTANPPQLTVTYTLSSGLVSLELKCPVHVADSSNREYEVIPPELPVTVEVPESLSRDRKYLDKLQAFVTPPTMAIGEEKVLKPRFQKPEGMIIPGSSRHIVTVRYLGDPEEKNL